MKAIILAGGYATRLQPLTDDLSKCLLPVGGKPMVDWILERIRGVEEIDEVHVVTNSRFAQDFEHWAMFKGGVIVHDDGTSSNEDRLGAIGDVAFTLDRAGIVDDDVIVIAGDNLFDYDLQDYVDFWRGKGVASAVAVRDVGDLRLASQYGIVGLDGDDRVIEFVEKPPEPTSTLAATATYIYHREHVPLVARYLAEGNPPDQSGQLHRVAALARAGLRLLGRRRCGSTSATRSSCSPPTTCSAGRRGCPSGTSTSSRSRQSSRTRDTPVTRLPVRSRQCSSTSCCRTGVPPAECPGLRLCSGCRDALIRLAPPLCDRCGSPGAWPVRRCAECSGRRIAFALRTCGDRLRRSGAAIRAGVEGARPAPTRPRGGRARRRDARAAVRTRARVRPGRRGAGTRGAVTGRPRRSPRSSGASGSCRSRRSSGGPARSIASEGSASRSAGATSAAPSRRRAHRRHASASSTTSTRAAPPPAPRHRRSGKAAPAEWRW